MRREARGGATRKVYGFVLLRGRKLMASSAVKRGEEGGRKEGRGEGLSQGPASHVLAVKSADRRDLSDPEEVVEIRGPSISSVFHICEHRDSGEKGDIG